MATAPAHPVRFKRVYVWELPVRVYHWINAAAVVVLIATGYLIGNPLTLFQSEEAYQQSWFGYLRFAHFLAGFAFLFNFLIRIYWSFVGNEFASWKNFIPYKKEQLEEIWEVLKVDILQTEQSGKISLGHNALAGMVYFMTFLVFLFQCATGFALYAGMSSSFIPQLFNWVVPLMGGEMAVRQWHHALMWFFVAFVIVHVYLVFYHDYVEGRGTTSSIVGGWKFDRESSDE